MKNFENMTDEELKDELRRIRVDRSGRGRERKREAKVKRMDGVVKEKKRKKTVKAIEEADWV